MSHDHGMSDIEIWKPVPGCVGIDVSNHGRVRNRWGRILRGSVRADGYRLVRVRVGGVGEYQSKYVHRMVLEAFVGPPPPGTECCHNNGNASNNHVSNLRWGTSSENSQDILRHGRNAKANRTHCPRQHPLVEGNLRPSQLRRGQRECLACARARNYAYRREMPVGSAEFQALADSYFSALGLEAEQRVAV